MSRIRLVYVSFTCMFTFAYTATFYFYILCLRSRLCLHFAFISAFMPAYIVTIGIASYLGMHVYSM